MSYRNGALHIFYVCFLSSLFVPIDVLCLSFTSPGVSAPCLRAIRSLSEPYRLFQDAMESDDLPFAEAVNKIHAALQKLRMGSALDPWMVEAASAALVERGKRELSRRGFSTQTLIDEQGHPVLKVNPHAPADLPFPETLLGRTLRHAIDTMGVQFIWDPWDNFESNNRGSWRSRSNTVVLPHDVISNPNEVNEVVLHEIGHAYIGYLYQSMKSSIWYGEARALGTSFLPYTTNWVGYEKVISFDEAKQWFIAALVSVEKWRRASRQGSSDLQTLKIESLHKLEYLNVLRIRLETIADDLIEGIDAGLRTLEFRKGSYPYQNSGTEDAYLRLIIENRSEGPYEIIYPLLTSFPQTARERTRALRFVRSHAAQFRSRVSEFGHWAERQLKEIRQKSPDLQVLRKQREQLWTNERIHHLGAGDPILESAFREVSGLGRQ